MECRHVNASIAQPEFPQLSSEFAAICHACTLTAMYTAVVLACITSLMPLVSTSLISLCEACEGEQSHGRVEEPRDNAKVEFHKTACILNFVARKTPDKTTGVHISYTNSSVFLWFAQNMIINIKAAVLKNTFHCQCGINPHVSKPLCKFIGGESSRFLSWEKDSKPQAPAPSLPLSWQHNPATVIRYI